MCVLCQRAGKIGRTGQIFYLIFGWKRNCEDMQSDPASMCCGAHQPGLFTNLLCVV